jgi:phage baseplate assembly protein W
MNLAYPFRVDDRKRTATTGLEDHVRDLIEQLALTGPGERVNRPTFGAGLQQLVFAPNSPELATALQVLVQGALQQDLAELIEMEAVEVEAVEERLTVQITYLVKRTQQRSTTRLDVGA